MTSCETPSLSLLLRNGDNTTITVLAGAILGSFILGVVSTTLVVRLCFQRPAKLERSSFIQRRPESALQTKPPPTEPFAIPVSPQSLSQTFIRHSVKPPMKMFDADGVNTWAPSYRRDKLAGSRKGVRNCFASEDSTIYNASGSESNCDVSRRDWPAVQLVCSVSRETIHGTEIARAIPTDGVQITRTKSEPSRRYLKDIGASNSASFHAIHSMQPRRPQPLPFNEAMAQRESAESKRPNTARDRTEFLNASVLDIRRARAFSSPQGGIGVPNDVHCAIEMPDIAHITVTSPTSTQHDSDDLDADLPVIESGDQGDQGARLARQLSNSQAASFYQAQAKRHLSMPFIGPRSSPSAVLPDSPRGVIGDVDLDPAANFSFARGKVCE